jgi:hypothetical protein
VEDNVLAVFMMAARVYVVANVMQEGSIRQPFFFGLGEPMEGSKLVKKSFGPKPRDLRMPQRKLISVS